MNKITDAIVEALKGHPAILALIICVFGFLFFMYRSGHDLLEFYDGQKLEQRTYQERQAKLNEIVHAQRITVCHQTQVEATDAMEKMAEALQRSAEATIKTQNFLTEHRHQHNEEMALLDELIEAIKYGDAFKVHGVIP